MSDLDDPDDAYDVTDPVPVRLLNFDHRLRYVIERLAVLDPLVLEAIRAEVAARVARLLDDLAAMRAELEHP